METTIISEILQKGEELDLPTRAQSVLKAYASAKITDDGFTALIEAFCLNGLYRFGACRDQQRLMGQFVSNLGQV